MRCDGCVGSHSRERGLVPQRRHAGVRHRQRTARALIRPGCAGTSAPHARRARPVAASRHDSPATPCSIAACMMRDRSDGTRPVDAVAEAIVRAQARAVAMRVEGQCVQRVAGEPCVAAMRSANAAAPSRSRIHATRCRRRQRSRGANSGGWLSARCVSNGGTPGMGRSHGSMAILHPRPARIKPPKPRYARWRAERTKKAPRGGASKAMSVDQAAGARRRPGRPSGPGSLRS